MKKAKMLFVGGLLMIGSFSLYAQAADTLRTKSTNSKAKPL